MGCRLWAAPVSRACGASRVQIMRWAPLRGLLVQHDTRLARISRAALGCEQHQLVSYFGDLRVLTEGLDMSNRLTAYVFVIDHAGKIRWRSSGEMTEADAAGLTGALAACCGDAAGA